MNNNERIYVDLHVLQTVPPSCVNRDDTGSPKTAVYGGVTRARVSSQAWKRAMRQKFTEILGSSDKNAVGCRTTRVFSMLEQEIREIAPDIKRDDAKKISTYVWNLIGISADRKTEESKVLVFVSTEQMNSLAKWAVANKDQLLKLASKKRKNEDEEGDEENKKEKKSPLVDEVVELMNRHPSLDQALFGRMVASKAVLNFDAAAQVAHAISTHAVENEFDYFTAVDDCAPKDNAGAGHLGTVEFNSSTLYRYATVNVGELQNMLGEKTPEAVRAFADAFIRSMPTGKQNTFANWTRPDAVYVTARRDQPVNMAGAFEKPVRAGAQGYVTNSVQALADYAAETYRDFVAAPVLSLAVGKGLEALAVPGSVDALLDGLEAWLKEETK